MLCRCVQMSKNICTSLKGTQMDYIIRIYANESYHLHPVKDGEIVSKAIPFRELLREPNPNRRFPLERKFQPSPIWERVGDISLRELLLLPIADNSLFRSLQKSRGDGYTWKMFCEARKSKILTHSPTTSSPKPPI